MVTRQVASVLIYRSDFFVGKFREKSLNFGIGDLFIMKRAIKKAAYFSLSSLAVSTLALVLPAINSNTVASAKAKAITVKVGVMTMDDEAKAEWKVISKYAKKHGNVTIKFVQFTDYSQPNKALEDGNIDLNAFQHYDFLDNWNKENHGDIKAIAKTVIAPIRLYTKKGYKSVKDLPKGAQIAIPNDATNEGRSLVALQTAGLIKLKKGVTLATPSDITSNPKKLKITLVDASQTARSLSSVDAAFVNNTFVSSAGLKFKSAIYVEPVNKASKKWINVIAAKPNYKKNKAKYAAYKEIIKGYHQKKVKQLIKKYSDGTELAAWDIKIK
ncbi:ABC transporter substrate-binding protein [Oenococcus oeni]|uniref:ABC transporter substrate-binding protein n=17 Tax=Lactobacillales TaxID=186826 RepID=A0A6H3GYN8_OENOE|nr:MetQ/NlpA family ABC transporter substrate-binding protein [Oenococcus oeni]KGH59849.1 ABC transporter substrate-binding protein [Oenococcus oeni IOEB_9805]KGH62482.1 ABC transporter substrate-binding protein [Oenococcus oeni S13]KGH72877.1 ABC transporter substrate-binding protein [Oenococcus oeni IOEB_0502]KGH75045.1 ABC transporter substrate-binding protein [Oenococcus oeni IOEB_9803]MDV7714203.1 ABC transporter substrate-binding protein [Oenococcus oeni]